MINVTDEYFNWLIAHIQNEYKVNITINDSNCDKNIAAFACNDIFLGVFDDIHNKTLALFHELGHILSNRCLCKRGTYFSKLSQEGLAWEIGLELMNEYGFLVNYDSEPAKWARLQYQSYFNSEYNELRISSHEN